MSVKVKSHVLCEGCSHIDGSENGCYMFKTYPEELPCAQHDIFAAKRNAAKPSTVAAAIALSLAFHS